jgi:putative ABC transport system ATP-binding protein
MSGGQQQRVAIARALITNPSLILADEPTGNLDTRTSLGIIALFQQVNLDRGMTVVYVTHEPDIAQHASRILQMRDGVVVSDVKNTERLWAPDELRKLGPVPTDLPEQREEDPPQPFKGQPPARRLAPTG